MLTILGHALALFLRVAFFVLAAMALIGVMRGGADRNSAIRFAFLAAVVLVASAALLVPAALPLLSATLALKLAFAVLLVRAGGSSPARAAFVPVVLLVTMGEVLMVDTVGPDIFYLVKFAFALVCCAVACWLFRRVPALYTSWRFWLIIMLLCCVLPLTPLGQETGGARIALTLAGATFMMSEVAKVGACISLGGFCSINAERLEELASLRGVAPAALGFIFALGFVGLQRDLALAALVAVTGMIAIVVSCPHRRWQYAAAFVIAFLAGAVAVIGLFPHVRERFSALFNPQTTDAAGGSTPWGSVVRAFGNTSFIGTGVGLGSRCFSVPNASTDYVFVVLAEELGLAGVAVAISCYGVLAALAACVVQRLGRQTPEGLTLLCLTVLWGMQTAWNILGVLNLLPLTGVVLPLVSQGDTALAMFFATVGVGIAAAQGPVRESAGDQSKGLMGTLGRAERRAVYVPLCIAGALVSSAFGVVVPLMAAEDGALPLVGTTSRMITNGHVLARDGTVLAEDGENGERVYPEGRLAAHVLGAVDGVPGFSANEQTLAMLTGEDEMSKDPVGNAFGLPAQGKDVRLTLDAGVQAAAEKLLDGYDGAVVVADARTGEVLALASSRPPDLALLRAEGVTAEVEESCLIQNLATQGRFQPGSTFKVVTLTAALEAGYHADSMLDAAGGSIGGGALANAGDEQFTYLTLAEATDRSVNTAYGPLGVKLGSTRLANAATALGITQEEDTADLGLPVVNSQFNSSELDTWGLAWAACGQAVEKGGPSVTPLALCRAMAVIAQGGSAPSLHVVCGGSTDAESLELTGSAICLTSDIADELADILNQDSYQRMGEMVGLDRFLGKTGTAERGGSTTPDAWFIGAAEKGEACVAIAVVRVGGGYGNTLVASSAELLAEALRCIGGC